MNNCLLKIKEKFQKILIIKLNNFKISHFQIKDLILTLTIIEINNKTLDNLD